MRLYAKVKPWGTFITWRIFESRVKCVKNKWCKTCNFKFWLKQATKFNLQFSTRQHFWRKICLQNLAQICCVAHEKFLFKTYGTSKTASASCLCLQWKLVTALFEELTKNQNKSFKQAQHFAKKKLNFAVTYFSNLCFIAWWVAKLSRPYKMTL